MVCAKNGEWFNKAHHRGFLHLNMQKETHFLSVLAKVYGSTFQSDSWFLLLPEAHFFPSAGVVFGGGFHAGGKDKRRRKQKYWWASSMSWYTSKGTPNRELLVKLATFHTAFGCWKKFVSVGTPLSRGDAQVTPTRKGRFQVPDLSDSSLAWEESLICCTVGCRVVAWAPSFALWKVNQAAPKKGLVE